MRNMSSVGIQLNYKFILRAEEALADLDYCIYVVEDSNLDLVSQISQKNTLELTILKSNVVYKEFVDNPLHIKKKKIKVKC